MVGFSALVMPMDTRSQNHFKLAVTSLFSKIVSIKEVYPELDSAGSDPATSDSAVAPLTHIQLITKEK